MTPFVSPPDPPAYHARVWEVVARIPEGRVCTYGAIAAAIPAPPGVDDSTYRAFGPRWVGSALARCPEDLPWHRVVNAQGGISPRRGEGPIRQRERLQAEGVLFDERDRIDLSRFEWDPGKEAHA